MLICYTKFCPNQAVNVASNVASLVLFFSYSPAFFFCGTMNFSTVFLSVTLRAFIYSEVILEASSLKLRMRHIKFALIFMKRIVA